jgi:hypothetical protein
MTLLPDRQRRGKGQNRVDAKPRTHAALADASVNGQKIKRGDTVAIRHTHLLRAVRPWFGLPARLACPRFLALDNAWSFPPTPPITGHFSLFMFQPSLPGGIRGQSFFVQVFGGDKQ